MVGFPDSVTARVREVFAEHGYDVRIKRVRFNPLDGVVADRFHLFLDPADLHPAVEAKAVVLGFDPRAWVRGEPGLRRVRVRDGVFRLNTVGPLTDPDGPRVIRLDSFGADIRLEEHAVRVAQVHARMNALEIRGRGFVMRDPAGAPTDKPVTPALLREFAKRHSVWLSTMVEELNAIDYETPPQADFDFYVNLTEPVRHEVAIEMKGAGTRLRGLLFDGWALEAHYDGRHIRIPSCTVFREDRRFEGEAVFDMDEHVAEVRMYLNLLPVYWRNLMPAGLREQMELARIHPFGPTEAALTIGPSPFTEFGDQLEGWFRAEQLEAHGVWLESIRADITRRREHVKLDRIEAEVGRDEERGPLRGEAEYDIDKGEYRGRVTASFDPHAVLPVAGYSVIAADIIQSITFIDTHPTIDVDFSGRIRPNAAFNFSGDMHGTNFLFSGSHILRFESTFLVTNRVMRMDPLRIERDEGRLDGWYQQDFTRKITDLDVVSGIDPKALARVGGGTVERILRPFRFEGPAQLHVYGRVDYGDHEETDYVATGEAKKVGWRWISADSCSMDWIAQGRRITMTNVHMRVYGGLLTGDVALDGVGHEAVDYRVRAEVSDVVFAELLREVRQTEADHQEGRLSGRISVQGVAEDDWRATVQGDGRIRIRDGQVFQIPLLGGLSQLLGRIYPRLGFATQTDARADFAIGDRRISTDGIRIEGALLSLWGEGSYHLDDELDFKVQVRPLRRGFLVDAVRFVTYPVSRLLQFRLEGTLSEPHWAIDSLPRELWSLFEREAE